MRRDVEGAHHVLGVYLSKNDAGEVVCAILARCGFDAFAVRVDKDIHDALNAFREASVLYQGALDEPLPLFRRRGPTQAGA